MLKQYFSEMFTLYCKVNAFAKYSDGIMLDTVVNNNDNQHAFCPTGASKYTNNEELSKYIDKIHQHSELLEGG